ncbi:7793_t:CDS:2, partial [Acaulospora morrowiae]
AFSQLPFCAAQDFHLSSIAIFSPLIILAHSLLDFTRMQRPSPPQTFHPPIGRIPPASRIFIVIPGT